MKLGGKLDLMGSVGPYGNCYSDMKQELAIKDSGQVTLNFGLAKAGRSSIRCSGR